MDVESFRMGRRGVPCRGYEALLSTDRWTPRRLAEAEQVLAEGWLRGSFPRVRLVPPVAWDEVCAENRSWHFHLQAWEPMAAPLSAHDHTGRGEFATYCLELAEDWVRQFPTPASESPFAWYDMAVGVRAYRLGYLLDVTARDEAVDDATVAALVDSALVHAAELAREDRFAGHSNHGLYQAAGQLALAVRFPELPGMDAHRVQARQRLDEMLRAQFTSEGVHAEHSPGYHYLLLDTAEQLARAGLVEGEATTGLLQRAREALAWFVLPDRRLVMIGDTSERELRDEPFARTDDPALRFAATAGESGAPPAERMRAFPESGFVVMRDRWPRGPEDFADCSHLAQICAFHSRAHKHADDLSFTWYDHGTELLVDAGRYGYVGMLDPQSELAKRGFRYADPNRIYVESTRAHNTVEIDGRSYPRTDGAAYGSALREWGDDGAVMFSKAVVSHAAGVEHSRLLLYHPRSWLLVIDALDDPSGAPHSFSQRFHFAPELEAHAQTDGVVRLVLPGDRPNLFVVPLAESTFDGVAAGRREPELLGFVSRRMLEMTPCPTAAYLAAGCSAHLFAALLCFGSTPPEVERTDGIGVGESAATLAWRSGGARHTVILKSGIRSEDPVAFDYTSGPAGS